MKLILALIPLFTLLIVQPMQANLKSLKSLQWEARILLIHGPESKVTAMATELSKASAQIDERDLVWFAFGASAICTNYVGSLPDGFADSGSDSEKIEVQLVGKDGGLKASYNSLNLDAIFARIDSMPMRQAEMRASAELAEKRARRLFIFTGDTPSTAWRATNDGVMGGLSQGGARIVEEGMRFSGVLSLENNGGFSSVYTSGPFDLSAYQGLRFLVMGDGRTYQLRLNSDAQYQGRGAVSFGKEFATQPNEWVQVFVPFSELKQTWRGRQLSGYTFNAAEIRRIGFMLADKQPGEFSLLVKWLDADRSVGK